MKNVQTRHRGVGQRLFPHIGLNFIGQGLLLLLNLVTAPYIVHHLGAELFAVVALVQTIAGFAGVLNIGIGRALTKLVSGLYWQGETDKINEIFQTAWATCFISGFIGILLLVGPGRTIAGFLFPSSPGVSDDLANFAVYVAAFGLFTSMLLEAISAIPTATQRFGVCNAIRILTGVVWSLGSVALLAAGCSIRAVLLVNLLSNLIGVSAFVVASRRIIPGLKFAPYIHLNALRTLLTFSLPLMISAVTALISLRIDRFILVYYLPLTAVTFYTLPYSLSEKITLAVSNVISVVYPLTSELHARNDHQKLQEVYLHSNRILLLVTLPITVILVTLRGRILQFWLGEEYAVQGAACLAVLGVAAFVNSVSAVPTVTSLGVGRAWMPSGFSSATSILCLALNFLLVPHYGINGAAWALLISNAAVTPLFVHALNRALGLSSWRFLGKTFVRPCAVAVVQFAFLFEIRDYITSLVSLLIVSAMSFLVFGLASLLIVMTRQERLILFRKGAELFAVPSSSAVK